MIKKQLLIALWFCSTAQATQAQTDPDAPRLTMPLACNIGVDCFIQNYVDNDASTGYRDYHCGFLSYDDHRGTDFRPKAINALEQGVPVLAAADGEVRAIRDGMDDVNVRVLGRQALQGKDAGNSVVIVHGNGWETQYAHLKKGSVAVHAKQPVTRGTVLGLVGLSGNTEFTHLHFEIRHNGTAIDPFVGVNGADTCALGKQALWSTDTLANMDYRATGIIAAGITDHALTANEVLAENLTLAANAPALVVWLTLFGVQTGDQQLIDIFAPDGSPLLHQAITIDHNMAQYRSFVGLKKQSPQWQVGDYRVSYQLLRQQHTQSVLNQSFNFKILPL